MAAVAVSQPQAKEPGAAIVVDGAIVLVDLEIGKLNGKQRCVVIRPDGSIGIETPTIGLKFWRDGRRGGYYDLPELQGGAQVMSSCVILGKVIEAA